MTSIQIEDLSEVKKKITFEIPQERVQDVINEQFSDLKKTVQIKGFRKGKVPMNILRSYFKSQVESETARKIIEETFESGLTEKKINPIAVISMDQDGIETGKPFKYWAEVEVPPPVDVQDYKGLPLKKTVRILDEGDVDKRIQKLRESNARLTPLQDDRSIRPGDHIVVDINAEIDNEPAGVLTVTDYHLEVDRNFYLPDFDGNFIGLKIGETKEVTVDLPADFPRKDMAGKTGRFVIVVKEAKEKILSELDDDFAKDLGFDTLDALKEEIRKDIRASHDYMAKAELENQIVDALIEKNEFDLPEKMVENQVNNILSQSMQTMVARGIDPKRIPPPTDLQRNQMRPTAVRQVKTELLLKSVADKENIEVSDEELDAAIAERAGEMGFTQDHLKDQLEKNHMMEGLRESVLHDKVYKFIIEQAEITEKEASASEIEQETKEE